MKRLLSILLSLMLLSVTFALGETAQEEAAADTLMVTANGEQITKGELDEIMATVSQFYSQQGYDVTTEDAQYVLRQIALRTWLNSMFIRETAQAENIELTEEETERARMSAQADYEELISQILSYYSLTPSDSSDEAAVQAARDQAEQIALSYGYSPDYFLDSYMDYELQQKVSAFITRDVDVTEEEIQALLLEKAEADKNTYQDNLASYEVYSTLYHMPIYYVPAGFRGIIHILLKVDEDLMSTYHDLQARLEEQENAAGAETTGSGEGQEAQGTAPVVTQADVDQAYQAILDSLKPTMDEIMARYAAGTPFEDLVVEYGQDPGMTGDRLKEGYPVAAASRVYVPAFVQAAFSVDHVGDVSEPYLSDLGMHIVQYVRDVPSGPVEMTDEIRETLRTELLSSKSAGILNAAFEAWIAGLDITYTEAGEIFRLDSGETN